MNDEINEIRQTFANTPIPFPEQIIKAVESGKRAYILPWLADLSNYAIAVNKLVNLAGKQIANS